MRFVKLSASNIVAALLLLALGSCVGFIVYGDDKTCKLGLCNREAWHAWVEAGPRSRPELISYLRQHEPAGLVWWSDKPPDGLRYPCKLVGPNCGRRQAPAGHPIFFLLPDAVTRNISFGCGPETFYAAVRFDDEGHRVDVRIDHYAMCL